MVSEYAGYSGSLAVLVPIYFKFYSSVYSTGYSGSTLVIASAALLVKFPELN
jgi:hypothetical protein